MKHITKILALALALIMVLGLATTVSAADSVEITIAESVSGASVAGHTFHVYQIFSGNVASDGVTLTDVEFGANYKPANTTVDAAMAALTGKTGAEAAALLEGELSGEPVAVLADPDFTAEVPSTGYYLIIDVTENLPENETASALILQLVGDTTIQSKHDTAPTTYKKVDDVNDSTGEEVEIQWHDSADHDIGDLIDFQLNAVIPGTIEAFRTAQQAYPFTFHDEQSDGLTFEKITRVYVVNGDVETEIADYNLVQDPTDDCTFEVKFDDLTAIEAIQSGSRLVVEYQAELNEGALLGYAGNPNEMRGEFRNLYKPTEPEYTPWDKVIVFTYHAEVNKVDPEKKPLEGAAFELHKFEVKEDGTQEYKVGDKTYKGEWKLIALEADEDDTLFYFKGLDDGYYRVTETAAPDGYNKIDPFYFTITAEHDLEADDPKLTALDGKGDLVDFEVDKASADRLSADVVNQKGVELPSTGGIGTTIFYIVGGLLAVAAVVLLVTKKRMASAE